MDICVIGAGISGMAMAQLLKDRHQVVVFESESRPGGLIKCNKVDGCLFHLTGGHVFNTKREDVMKWFWSFFDKDEEFLQTERNAVVSMPDGRLISYPIENHAYQMEESMMRSFVADLVSMSSTTLRESDNFGDFLLSRFGPTLYNAYFQSYNEKIWGKDLSKIPLSWLDGKLPMPTLEEILYNNISRAEERQFVHSRFFYPQKGGSQMIADRFAKGLDILYDTTVNKISYTSDGWNVNGRMFDKVIFCGNIKQLPSLIDGVDISSFYTPIGTLNFHGTTTVFCRVSSNPYSWVYLPSRDYLAHRIICTGNFSPANNANDDLTATVEFTDCVAKDEILENINRMPFSPQYIAHHYAPYSYPLQNADTRMMINNLKRITESRGLYLLGRFAEWEYYNMDVAMGAAMDLVKRSSL